jgi:hypothetical protein
LVIAIEVDVIPDPIQIDGRINAIVFGARGTPLLGWRRLPYKGKHVSETLKATDSHNGFDLPV